MSTPRKPRADARRNRAAVVDAARRVFAERGTDAPLDAIARAANVGSATLYRHFPTRRELVVAVYADEVQRLCDRAEVLASTRDPAAALFDWLAEFVAHVSSKRDLALTATEGADGDRSRLFDGWHRAVRGAAGRLLDAARNAGAVTVDASTADLVALANGIAMSSADESQARRLLELLRAGLTGAR